MVSRTRLAVLLVIASCAGSGARTGEPRWERPAAAPAPLKIIDKDTAEKTSVHSEDFDVPFGDGQNGTELLMFYLHNAKQRNAAYVSDLYVAMMFKLGANPIECRSRVYLEDEAKAKAKAKAAAKNLGTVDKALATSANKTKVQEFKPKTIAYRATDMELTCEKHGVMVMSQAYSGHDLTEEFDVSNSWRDREHTFNGRQATVQYEDVCEKHPITRDTVRYDYQAKLGFVPVNWSLIQKRYADETLVEDAPACYLLEASEALRPHHIVHGRLYYRAGTADFHMAPNADIVEHYRVEGVKEAP